MTGYKLHTIVNTICINLKQILFTGIIDYNFMILRKGIHRLFELKEKEKEKESIQFSRSPTLR